ncbi:MAG: helix-turn-helix transcriptional regulator [Rhodomicrobium sp.]
MQSGKKRRLIRLKVVLSRVGYSRSTIYALIKEGRFPQQVKIGPRASAWDEDEVQEWINSRAKPAPAEANV